MEVKICELFGYKKVSFIEKVHDLVERVFRQCTNPHFVIQRTKTATGATTLAYGPFYNWGDASNVQAQQINNDPHTLNSSLG